MLNTQAPKVRETIQIISKEIEKRDEIIESKNRRIREEVNAVFTQIQEQEATKERLRRKEAASFFESFELSTK